MVLVIVLCVLGAYYFFFEKQKTEYYTNRDARVIAQVAAEIQQSYATLEGILKSLGRGNYKVYLIDPELPSEQRPASAIFTSIDLQGDGKGPWHDLRRDNEETKVTIANGTVVATYDLGHFLEPIISHMAGVFDTFLIVRPDGEILYQPARMDVHGSSHAELSRHAEMKIVRLQQMTIESLFGNHATLKPEDLASVSRHVPVRLGEEIYELFSVPMRPRMAGGKEVGSGWIVCGLVASDNFRAQSLAVSATHLCFIAGLVLLLILSWPFLKIALMSAQHKLALADVIFLGFSSALITAIICLGALDAMTYAHVKGEADDQLAVLASQIDEHFNREVAAAGKVLDRMASTAMKGVPAGDLDSTSVLSNPAAFSDYPWFQTIALIDSKGWQAKKWVVDKAATPRVSVRERTYFRAPLYGGRDESPFDSRFTVQSLRSLTTGEPELDISRRTDCEQYPVIAMAIPNALSVLHPILPESFRFAVIDAEGNVLLHSENERNTVENLFAETDGNRALRSLVAARQNETVAVRYLGEDCMAHVQPMTKFPRWTIVTLREERGLRAVNAEAVMTAFYFLLALTGCGLFIVCTILLFAPKYRAEWVWPDQIRIGDYHDLAFTDLLLLAAAACLSGSLDNTALFTMPLGFVPYVLLITWLHLLRGEGDPALVKRALASALTAGCFLLLVRLVRIEAADPVRVTAGKAAAILFLLLAGARAVLRRPNQIRPTGRHALPFAYVTVASLLLILVSVVPTIAFFQAAYRQEMSTYVKWVQMKLARDLRDRWWRVSTEFSKERGDGKFDLRKKRWQDRTDLYNDSAYDSWVCLGCTRAARPAVPGSEEPALSVPGIIEALLPHYSSESVNTRELIHSGAADGTWEWLTDRSTLQLFMRDRTDPHLSYEIDSSVPPLLLPFGSTPDVFAFVAVVLLIIAVAFAVALFVARKVFLVDVDAPLWLARGFPGLRRVICYPCDERSPQRLDGSPGFMRIDLYKPNHLDLLRTAPQSFPFFARTVFIDHLDYASVTGQDGETLRNAIERLMRNPERTIVIRPVMLSVIADGLYLREDGESWKKLLATFEFVDIRHIEIDRRSNSLRRSGAHEPIPAKPSGVTRQRRRWWSRLLIEDPSAVVRNTFEEEVRSDPYLRSLVEGLAVSASGRDQVLDEIAERAEEYYHTLWKSCTAGERLVIMQLAKTGLVNSKTRRDVRRLLARGLLRRTPQLRLLNETFRRYVFAQFEAAPDLAKQVDEDLAADAWTRMRIPLVGCVLVILLFFFVTQRELFDATFAVVTGLVTGLPVFLRVLSGLVERKAN